MKILSLWGCITAAASGGPSVSESRRFCNVDCLNKLRSYVRAAYQTARAARSKASIPVHFKAYNVGANPAADTEPDESQNKADKNPLTADQLRTYWQAIKALPGFRGAVLRLHLLTGGQRIEQLVNLLSSNVTGDSILLYDGKGRPGKPPRPHTVPLILAAASALLDCKPQGHYALSTDGGKTHLGAITLSAWAVEAAVEIPDFQAKRIRSGVETLLASVGVSTEIRGRLQSHGIAGVQARHYDGHDYLNEKRKALETLNKLLNQKPGRTRCAAFDRYQHPSGKRCRPFQRVAGRCRGQQRPAHCVPPVHRTGRLRTAGQNRLGRCKPSAGPVPFA